MLRDYMALEKIITENTKGIILETAHPVKFPDTVKIATGREPEMPDSILPLLSAKKISINMDASFDSLKEWLLKR